MLFSWGNTGETMLNTWVYTGEFSTKSHTICTQNAMYHNIMHSDSQPIHSPIPSTFVSVLKVLFHAFHWTYNNNYLYKENCV